MPGTADGPGRIFFEFRPLGAQMRVAAIDAETGIEVIVIAPVGAAQSHVQTIAAAKLKRKLAEGTRKGDAPRLF